MLEICEKVKKLMEKPMPEQRSKEWFEARRLKVTASSAASLLSKTERECGSYVKTYNLEDTFDYNGKCCNSYSSFEQFKMDKTIQPEFKTNVACAWGVKYEQIATDIYMLMKNTIVIEFGLLAHDTIPWLAASPDGITVDGTMLEIKCPFRRKITGIPLFVYWNQCQLQLEVCDLEVCDFFEVELAEVSSFLELIDDELCDKKPEYRGCLIQIETVPDVLEERKFIYPDRKLINDVLSLNRWAEDTIINELDSRNLEVLEQKENLVTCRDSRYKKYNFRTEFWRTQTISCVPIHRDKQWMSNIKPIMENKWQEILDFKEKYVPGEVIKMDIEEEDSCLF
jgi:putative phage-type endonuclease